MYGGGVYGGGDGVYGGGGGVYGGRVYGDGGLRDGVVDAAGEPAGKNRAPEYVCPDRVPWH